MKNTKIKIVLLDSDDNVRTELECNLPHDSKAYGILIDTITFLRMIPHKYRQTKS